MTDRFTSIAPATSIVCSAVRQTLVDFTFEHGRAKQAGSDYLSSSRKSGGLLLAMKQTLKLPHGEWEPWLEQYVAPICSLRTAQFYLTTARKWMAHKELAQTPEGVRELLRMVLEGEASEPIPEPPKTQTTCLGKAQRAALFPDKQSDSVSVPVVLDAPPHAESVVPTVAVAPAGPEVAPDDGPAATTVEEPESEPKKATTRKVPPPLTPLERTVAQVRRAAREEGMDVLEWVMTVVVPMLKGESDA